MNKQLNNNYIDYQYKTKNESNANIKRNVSPRVKTKYRSSTHYQKGKYSTQKQLHHTIDQYGGSGMRVLTLH